MQNSSSQISERASRKIRSMNVVFYWKCLLLKLSTWITHFLKIWMMILQYLFSCPLLLSLLLCTAVGSADKIYQTLSISYICVKSNGQAHHIIVYNILQYLLPYTRDDWLKFYHTRHFVDVYGLVVGFKLFWNCELR